ncbi:MAG: glycerophosphodiester phosphodiesterase [Clostridia bacterium]|nr:glycerophosphodiester phosphodiesterase [Clostridia bacterium]
MAGKRGRDFAEHYRLVAHRGLHEERAGIPENSLPAFRRAVEAGKAIEFDVHVTADNKLVVFHDEQLQRMTGVPGNIEEWSLADLRKLRLQKTEYGIPTLDEVLELVDGRVPLLIEIKNYKAANVGRLESRLKERLVRYTGEFILESFNPEVLVWLHRHAPQFIRGQLGNLSDENKGFQFYSSHLMFNPLTKPDFIAFQASKIGYRLRMTCKKKKIPLFGWTIRTEEELARARRLCDGVIYEHLEL